MGVGLKMSMKLSQQLRMTPQLQQAIKLLQLSRLELETEIRKELDENPVLEEVVEDAADDPAKKDASTSSEIEEIPQVKDQPGDQPAAQDEFDWENYVDSSHKPSNQGTGSGGGTDEIMNYENVISTPQSLQDYLLWQMKLSGFNEEEENIANILINYINDDGWIKVPLEEIAASEGVSVEDLEGVLPFIQEFDPPGVGARDLRECLLVQARNLEEDTNDLVSIINHHLKDLEKKNFNGIAKALNFPLDYVLELCKIIFDMDPKPGRAYMVPDTHFITPDVYVYKVGEDYVVSLNEEGLPRLRISNLYKNILAAKGSNNKDTQSYIQDKLRSAVWLIKSIHQRQRTIYKVAESIVKHQRDFLEKGSEHIKPMILRDVADDIGMHESTVSRVTTSKYIHTPQGIFELKYFFNSGISKTDGDSVASESVKMKIKELVAREDVKDPLSDQKIVELLKKEGIKIARRTVAKYREMLKILPSSKRKKYF